MASSSQRSMSSNTTATMACSAALLDDDLHRGVAQEDAELRRGPWTVDEDLTLVSYIADHGEGRWNSLARAAGLKRKGKSCRLRWLNYLRPDVKRGNFTADEQLLILDLHSRWGNRWSKIAQYLPGRTDNEIKNYWRTRVQKQAKQLSCDASSSRFKDAMRYLWNTPRFVDQRFQQAAGVVGDHGYTAGAGDHAVSRLASVGGMENSSMVTPSSSDSLASESYGGGIYANVHEGETVNGGDHWMQEANQGLWSGSTQDGNGQLQDPELTGWVQGFSDGLPENFWSLEDIWKMQ